MEPITSPVTGFAGIVLFGGVMFALTLFFSTAGGSKDQFLVGGRMIGAVAAGASIAATWIWAPALFIAAQKACTQGLAGLFWFTFANVGVLILFGWFAARVRHRFPAGYTASHRMRTRYKSRRVQVVYAAQLLALAFCSYAVQLLAGGYAIQTLTGLDFTTTTVTLALIALSYSLFSGLRASILTDCLQMGMILVVALTVIPWLTSVVGGPGLIVQGFAGPDGGYGDIFRWDVVLSFGIPVTIALMSGPFGDQSFWQRTFAIREGRVFAACLIGAGLFALVPLTLAVPGFLAGATGFEASSAQMVGPEMVAAYLPAWAAALFALMLLCGLVSTLDSCLCAVSSLAGHDGAKEGSSHRQSVALARWGMVAVAAGGLAIAHTPGLQILYLFLFYGTFRSATLIPTILAILDVPLAERGVFWGIVIALVVGLPAFTYGHLAGGGLAWTLSGSLGTVLGSAVIAVAVTRWAPGRAGAR